ncbi:hypothetical protein H9P43_005881 [Blastocladiella emersonii ATCC 22665]|nr:hypothetical protein H9P43_005881 [Blastocladiella emersonii ATCC 22665]
MRVLGYPQLVSYEAFRQPNFELVADLLLWMVKSYDPSADIFKSIATEDDRVAFIKAVAQHLATRAQLKLNTRKLYMADGSAVRELLKLADLFTQANAALAEDDPTLVHAVGAFHVPSSGSGGQSQSSAAAAAGAAAKKQGGGLGVAGGMVGAGDMAAKATTIRAARELASEITQRGAVLYELLAQEMEHRDLRSQALGRAIDLPSIEAAASAALRGVREESDTLAGVVAGMSSDAAALTAKIEKKKFEVDRRTKRLKSMQGVRPAYMDEFERVEAELKGVYAKYVRSLRNVAFLEQLVEDGVRAEVDKSEEAEMSLKRMQERLKEEELKMLRGGDGGLDSQSDDDDGDVDEDSFLNPDDDDDDLDNGLDVNAVLGSNSRLHGGGGKAGAGGSTRKSRRRRPSGDFDHAAMDIEDRLDFDDSDEEISDYGRAAKSRKPQPAAAGRTGGPVAANASAARQQYMDSYGISDGPGGSDEEDEGDFSLEDGDEEEDDDDLEDDDEDQDFDDDLPSGRQPQPAGQQQKRRAHDVYGKAGGGASVVIDDDDDAVLSGIVDYGDDGGSDGDQDDETGSDNDF